jgi:hypothetical protein
MSSPKRPKVVERDPVKDQLAAERKATLTANAEIASRKRDLRYSSFLATGGGQAGIERGRYRSALAQAMPTSMGTNTKLGGGA